MTRRNDKDRSLARYLKDRDVSCPGCGYNLRDLPQGTCPECGFGFDEQSLKSLATTRLSLRERLFGWEGFSILVAANLMINWIAPRITSSNGFVMLLFYGRFGLIGLAPILFLGLWARVRSGTGSWEPEQPDRLLKVAAFLTFACGLARVLVAKM